MSTRSQIGFYNEKEDLNSEYQALIYRHSDGYPESEYGVVEQLLPFLKEFKENRGIGDTEYCSARTLQYLCNITDNPKHEYTKYLGYGISSNFHMDIEYFYKIFPDCLEVYKCEWEQAPNDYTLIETHKIE